MEQEIYQIKSKRVNDWYKKSEEIYGNICLIQMFCNEYKEVDDFYKILQILQYTKRVADILYADLLGVVNRNT